MNRRTYLVSSGIGVSAFLAGCLDEFTVDDGDGSDDDNGDEDRGTDDADEPGPETAIDTYLEAAADEDVDALAEAVHSASPLRELIEAEGEPDDDVDPDDLAALSREESEVVVEDAGVEDLLNFEGGALFFEEDELEELLAEEEAVVIETTITPEHVVDADRWAVVTDDGEWRVFWTGEDDEPPENSEEAFDEPIADEDGDVVAEIDYDVDPVDDPDDSDGPVWGGEWAQVVLTDSPGIEADAVRIESTIAGSEFETYGEEPGAWSGSWANVQLNPTGDQIVVTAVQDDTETVVHREHYEP